MPQRYTIAKSRTQLQERFGFAANSTYKPVYNAVPGNELPVVTNENPGELTYIQWGLIPYNSSDRLIGDKLMHAKVELLKAKQPFADLILHKRCVIPADSFIIWAPRGDSNQAYRVTLQNQEPFLIAGIWDKWEDEMNSNVQFPTFAMITTEANEKTRLINERMPAILLPELEKAWLDTSLTMNEVLSLIKPIPEQMFRVNKLTHNLSGNSNNDPKLLQEQDQMGPGENLSLF